MNTARDTISVLIHLPRMFLSADENVLDKLPTTACISDYHIKLRMIYRSVSSLATDSPCGQMNTTKERHILHSSFQRAVVVLGFNYPPQSVMLNATLFDSS